MAFANHSVAGRAGRSAPASKRKRPNHPSQPQPRIWKLTLMGDEPPTESAGLPPIAPAPQGGALGSDQEPAQPPPARQGEIDSAEEAATSGNRGAADINDAREEPVACTICKFWLNGPRQYQGHLRGRKHRKNERRLRKQGRNAMD